MNLIRESKSPHSSPPFMVRKHTEIKRIVINYKEVNKNTKIDGYYIPNKEINKFDRMKKLLQQI